MKNNKSKSSKSKFPTEVYVHFYDEGGSEGKYIVADTCVDDLRNVETGTRIAVYKLVTEHTLSHKTTLQ